VQLTSLAQKLILTAIWWGFGILLISVFMWLSSVDSVFGLKQDIAVDWLLPHLIPTMTLTGAAAYAGSDKAAAREKPTGKAPFVLACVASVFYLALLSFIIVTTLAGSPQESANGVVDALLSKNKILGVFQGLAASAIGVFFVKR